MRLNGFNSTAVKATVKFVTSAREQAGFSTQVFESQRDKPYKVVEIHLLLVSGNPALPKKRHLSPIV